MSLHIADRYTKAVHSTNLRTQAYQASDADVLIASGKVLQERRMTPLVVLLYRARAEWDLVDKAELSMLLDSFVTPRRETKRKLCSLTHLRDVFTAKEAMRSFVCNIAKHLEVVNTEVPMRDLLHLADLLFAHYLQPKCATCNGVRFKLVPNTNRLSNTACTACQGTGERRIYFQSNGQPTAMHYRLVGAVQQELSRKVAAYNRKVSNWLKGRSGHPR